MVFANPTYLWALLGLLVPLAIHFWSKKEAKTIKIGSIQLLDESNSRQSSNIQLNEWLLLLLRMAIVALVVLLMAGPQWRIKGNKNVVTYLVEPSLAQEKGLSTILDSLAEDSPVLLLDESFPTWEADLDLETDQTTPNYWQLSQKLDSLTTDSIVVFTKAYVQGVFSKRPITQKKVHWVVMESDEITDEPLMAIEKASGMQLYAKSGNGSQTFLKSEVLTENYSKTTDGDSLQINMESGLITVPLVNQDSILVNLFVEDGFETDQKYTEAALRALLKYLEIEIDIHIKEELDDSEANANLNIWLKENRPNESKGTWLIFQESPLAKTLIEEGGQQGQFVLTSRLTSKNTVEQRYAEQLLQVLDLDAELKQLLAKADDRQMVVAEFKPTYQEPKTRKELATLKDITLWVFLILTVLMMAERIISFVKKQ
ncbi:BatA domain-containing protein [Flagellimonas zhangzhouensis]|uniref:N-terminal double-transmembrane domain-containing protein n=1 Tax=Flagellimonas zhangzhouensis TaxID=1073328 RepID=A0A1H2Y8C5_9FLAO|nr:BatA domain-containing protein [Allomuricauda zhangzhouensis]SDQ98497.1 N-terminal double-transmembrane domain-containing protein [Allomuricauda zhangzhouensis]SDX01291.1 N-terminal double-transmembrane domain-containing protein [Allomuricauda zhangzhouensis]